MRKNITADGTGILVSANGDFYVFVTSGSDLGGGTLTLGIRDSGSGDALIPIDTLIAGDSGVYALGRGVELHYTLSSATDPDITMMVTVSN